MSNFGELLRERRRAAGMSQRELAAATGLDFSYISKLENGRIPPPAADTVIQIGRALKTSSEDLLAASGKLPPRVQAAVSSSPAAQSFLNSAMRMNLTDEEWRELTSSLSRLRD
jgi:HTH-type transcriptional regulator, competence development regulator